MRRSSDIEGGERTGRGRRARDRLLRGDPPARAAAAPSGRSSELDNLLALLGDDLRESGLALGGVERYLVAVGETLGADRFDASAVAALLAADDTDDRVAELDAALAALRQTLTRLRRALTVRREAHPAPPATTSA